MDRALSEVFMNKSINSDQTLNESFINHLISKEFTKLSRGEQDVNQSLFAETLRGDPIAPYDLAMRYEYGQGVAKNKEKSYYLYLLAALRGNPDAQLHIWKMFLDGQQVTKDEEIADLLFGLAAKKGNTEALFRFAVAYELGQGVVQDVRAALCYYEQAATAGDADALVELGRLYYKGKGEIAQDKTKALEYLKKAEERGYVQSKFYLGAMFFEGQGVEADLNRAIQLFEEAAAKGHPNSLHILGMLYEKNYLPENRVKQFELFSKAAARGMIESIYSLGVMYLNGHGDASNEKESFEKAFSHFEEAAGKGHVESRYYIGLMYERGLGIVQNKEEAINAYKLAESLGSNRARLALEKLTLEVVAPNRWYSNLLSRFRNLYQQSVGATTKIYRMKSFGRSEASGSEVRVVLHDKHSPTERLRIAREQGKSACVFVDEATSNSAAFDLDFYYPHARSKLCLHAVLAASKLYFENNIASETVIFRTALDQQHIVSRRQGDHVFLSVKKYAVPLISLDLDMVASMLCIPTASISAPPIVGSIGSPKLLVSIGNAEHLAAMAPNLEEIVRWGQEQKISGCFVYHQFSHDGLY